MGRHVSGLTYPYIRRRILQLPWVLNLALMEIYMFVITRGGQIKMNYGSKEESLDFGSRMTKSSRQRQLPPAWNIQMEFGFVTDMHMLPKVTYTRCKILRDY